MKTLLMNPESRRFAQAAELEVTKRSDRLMNYFLSAYFLGGILLAFFYDTWAIAFGVGGLSLLAYYSAKWIAPGSALYQYVLSAVLAVFMAQYIYQMHGLFEMHFTAFIGSAILITYQNWKLQIPMCVLVVGHHATFGYLQDAGFDKIYFTQLESFALNTFIIHIILAAVIFFTCGLWAYQLRKYSVLQISQVMEMSRLQEEARIVEENHKKEQEQQAEALDRAVTQGKFEIASDVLHDIGNAVVGFGSYLTRTRGLLENTSFDKLEKLSGFIKKEKTALTDAIGETRAGAMTNLLDGVLEVQQNTHKELRTSIKEQFGIISRIQEILNIQRQYVNGKETHERKPVNVSHVINDSVSMLFSAMDKQSIIIKSDFGENLPLIKGDRTRLMQVILNILKNSIEATAADCPEKIISLRLYQDQGALVLEVRDNGQGFDESIAGHLFERGFTAKTYGAGMGLYNCQAILKSHGGTFELTSEGKGKGSLAVVRLKV